MKNGDGFVLVYSITSTASFETTQRFRAKILQIKDEKPDVRADEDDSV